MQNFIKLSAEVHELTEKHLATMLKTMLGWSAFSYDAVVMILKWKMSK